MVGNSISIDVQQLNVTSITRGSPWSKDIFHHDILHQHTIIAFDYKCILNLS